MTSESLNTDYYARQKAALEGLIQNNKEALGKRAKVLVTGTSPAMKLFLKSYPKEETESALDYIMRVLGKTGSAEALMAIRLKDNAVDSVLKAHQTLHNHTQQLAELPKAEAAAKAIEAVKAVDVPVKAAEPVAEPVAKVETTSSSTASAEPVPAPASRIAENAKRIKRIEAKPTAIKTHNPQVFVAPLKAAKPKVVVAESAIKEIKTMKAEIPAAQMERGVMEADARMTQAHGAPLEPLTVAKADIPTLNLPELRAKPVAPEAVTPKTEMLAKPKEAAPAKAEPLVKAEATPLKNAAASENIAAKVECTAQELWNHVKGQPSKAALIAGGLAAAAGLGYVALHAQRKQTENQAPLQR